MAVSDDVFNHSRITTVIVMSILRLAGVLAREFHGMLEHRDIGGEKFPTAALPHQ
jgi:hypothetical protein